MSSITLYGTPLSLYTGRARSYFIKAGLAYREVTPNNLHYLKKIVPQAGGRQGMPTIETADGTVIRDGAAIIEHFEAIAGHPFSPSTPKQRILSLLFDVIGAEGLLRPAMHYRWNFPKENLEFLRFHFQSVMPPGPERAANAETAADRMRAACSSFGAVPETFELVESLYQELLKKLDRHFGEQPYLLGSKPCIGDFGLIAPLYAHLGRDPKPLSLMQAEAIRLFRWVERMNRPELDVGEFEIQNGSYLAEDQVPDSLLDLLRHIAIDFVPETAAAAACINQWIEAQEVLAPGTPLLRGVGSASFEVQGTTINALAQPYRFYLLERAQSTFASLSEQEQQTVADMLRSCSMYELLDIKLTRDIGRKNNLEIWL
ncbi:MAG: glutathione S-transferase family protein [Pseudomonadales bacterium]